LVSLKMTSRPPSRGRFQGNRCLASHAGPVNTAHKGRKGRGCAGSRLAGRSGREAKRAAAPGLGVSCGAQPRTHLRHAALDLDRPPTATGTDRPSNVDIAGRGRSVGRRSSGGAPASVSVQYASCPTLDRALDRGPPKSQAKAVRAGRADRRGPGPGPGDDAGRVDVHVGADRPRSGVAGGRSGPRRCGTSMGIVGSGFLGL